jgi:translation initiation factor 4A
VPVAGSSPLAAAATTQPVEVWVCELVVCLLFTRCHYYAQDAVSQEDHPMNPSGGGPASAAAVPEGGSAAPIPPAEGGGFEGLGLRQELIAGIESYGLLRPSAYQLRALPPVLAGRDAILQAPSGAGKTLALAMGLMQRIDPEAYSCQALVLLPVRELAQNMQQVFGILGEPMRARARACVGGRGVLEDIEALHQNNAPHVVLGTPGRILNLLTRGDLRLGDLRVLAFDEADQLLDRGFAEQIQEVLTTGGLPQGVQVVLTACTLPQEVEDVLVSRCMRHPVRVVQVQELRTLEHTRHYCVEVASGGGEEGGRLGLLAELLAALRITQAVIFCSTRRSCEAVLGCLAARALSVSMVHGEMEQQGREAALRDFRAGGSRLLISTPGAVEWGAELVGAGVAINFDTPRTPEEYFRRVGRPRMRFVRRAVAITLAEESDALALVRGIGEAYGVSIEDLPEDVSDLLQDP